MTDKEMLEYAARAAGIDIEWQPCGWAHDNNTGCEWNPLTDDGDALRLAVKLGIIIEYRREISACFAYHYNSNLEVVQRNDQLDPYAATRRAIVRAAAEIGRQMK